MNPLRHASSLPRAALLCLGMSFTALLSACGGGDTGLATGTALYTTAPSGLIMSVKETATFKAGGGTPNYNVTTNDASIATVAINGASFTITAVASGQATISVNDAAGATVSVPLTVK